MHFAHPPQSTTISKGAREPQPSIPKSGDDFTMHATVRVWRGDEEVRDAMVMLTSDRGAVRLHDEGDAVYTALQVGYAPSYQLDVVAGTDYMKSAVIEGPKVHLFESPLPGATQPAGTPLMVRWSPAGGATAMIQTKLMDEVATDDTGEFMVPAAVIVAGQDVRTDEVRVVRVVSAPLAGTAGASQLDIRLRNDVGFAIVPN